ncbi:hypothetical protein EUBVEN_01403 [Eubacterium ventriosum ATCC 27560]|uniref:Uncharacterized protein n=1 Tax=Eubacterium ventriosum ATCC 27560 TaxID=411463 RepID=A5Z6S1_9FIRM|nr:hypothetical protein EUBVEN_01403 [Eubacterium ventriosum ATCC 27560]
MLFSYDIHSSVILFYNYATIPGVSISNALSIINRSAKSCIEIFNLCIVLCCILVNAI